MISQTIPETALEPCGGTAHPASFRDPGGFVFRDAEGTLLRQIHASAEPDFEHLLRSGLYEKLAAEGLLIEHEEEPLERAANEAAVRVIRPRELPFIAYPYEWSFEMLREAALLTLRIQRLALARDMSLKDATAFNVQFEGTRPRFIDTLSLERYEPGTPWRAYGQFCRHFLAPLALMAYRGLEFGRLTALHLDGLPLETVSRLLPWRTRLRGGLLMHLHSHAWFIDRHQDTHAAANAEANSRAPRSGRFTKDSLLLLLDSLQRTVLGLRRRGRRTEWSEYYADNSYSAESFHRKQALVRVLLGDAPGRVWDLGGNTGVFSRLAARTAEHVVSFDIDPACVDHNFQDCRREAPENVLPLVMDFTNPTPALGWAGAERASLAERGPCDTALALALVHHLAIAGAVPLPRLAEWFALLCRRLVIAVGPYWSLPRVPPRRLRSRRRPPFHARTPRAGGR